MEQLTHIDFAFGPGGWVKAWWRRGGPEKCAYVRFKPRKTDWWIIDKLQVDMPTAESLREIPLHRIAVAFNALEMKSELREWIDDEVPSDLDKAFRERYRPEPRKNLKRPAQRKLDDDFFRQVAFTYREAVIRGLNPGQTIAADAGVPHSTASRWIALARQKKFLPPPQRGKVTV